MIIKYLFIFFYFLLSGGSLFRESEDLKGSRANLTSRGGNRVATSSSKVFNPSASAGWFKEVEIPEDIKRETEEKKKEKKEISFFDQQIQVI